jgi:hypothetical protein
MEKPNERLRIKDRPLETSGGSLGLIKGTIRNRMAIALLALAAVAGGCGDARSPILINGDSNLPGDTEPLNIPDSFPEFEDVDLGIEGDAGDTAEGTDINDLCEEWKKCLQACTDKLCCQEYPVEECLQSPECQEADECFIECVQEQQDKGACADKCDYPCWEN